MTEGKRNIIQGLLQKYDIEFADDIQDALKDLLSGTLKEMMETEMDNHLGYDRYERSEENNYRNGTKSKRVRSKYGEFEVDVPQDRNSSFDSKVLPKRQKDTSPDEPTVLNQLEKVTSKWEPLNPTAMNRWSENWGAISPIFKFSKDVRTDFYTTNAIESLNASYCRLNRQRSVFTSSQALLKALYPATFEVAKKWKMPIRNWGKVRGELIIMYPDRMPE